MSTSASQTAGHSQSHTYECAYCDGERTPETSVKGSFCSTDCYWRHKGDKAINTLRHSHTLCTCGARLKEVSDPPESLTRRLDPETERALVGYQYRTPTAEIGAKSFRGTHEFDEIVRTGTVCECGVTDTRRIDEDLVEIHIETVLANYVRRFRELFDEGQIDQQIDKTRFFETYRETRDLRLSLGRALYD